MIPLPGVTLVIRTAAVGVLGFDAAGVLPPPPPQPASISVVMAVRPMPSSVAWRKTGLSFMFQLSLSCWLKKHSAAVVPVLRSHKRHF
jgi:hypothetical protein